MFQPSVRSFKADRTIAETPQRAPGSRGLAAVVGISPLLFLLLLASCNARKIDPDEITGIFERHSFAETDLHALHFALVSQGPAALSEIDRHAEIVDTKKRLERDYPLPANMGCGLLLMRRGGKTVVLRVFEGSGAFLAGVREGDGLLSLNGEKADSFPDAVLNKLLFGSAGGVVAAQFEKKDGNLLEVKLRRDFGLYPNVWGFMLPGNDTGYVRILSFSMKASEPLKKLLADFERAGIKELVLDVRHNSGGSLAELALALELFSDGKKRLFRVMSRHPGYSRDFSPRGAGAGAGMKLRVLTDSRTGSRAEIFAASLKETAGAEIIGSATAGDVSITRTFRLADRRGLKLTVARMFPPSGAALEEKGLVPDRAAPETGEPEGLGFDLPSACLNADPSFMKAI